MGGTGGYTIITEGTGGRSTHVTGFIGGTVNVAMTIGNSPGLTSLWIDTCPAFVFDGQYFIFIAFGFGKHETGNLGAVITGGVSDFVAIDQIYAKPAAILNNGSFTFTAVGSSQITGQLCFSFALMGSTGRDAIGATGTGR